MGNIYGSGGVVITTSDAIPRDYADLTDPTAPALAQAFVDSYNGAHITATTAGYVDVLGTPSNLDNGKRIGIINNDTSTENIEINGETIKPAEFREWIWDGDTWIVGGGVAETLYGAESVVVIEDPFVDWNWGDSRNFLFTTPDQDDVDVEYPTGIEQGHQVSVMFQSTNPTGTNYRFNASIVDTNGNALPDLTLANGEAKRIIFGTTNALFVAALDYPTASADTNVVAQSGSSIGDLLTTIIGSGSTSEAYLRENNSNVVLGSVWSDFTVGDIPASFLGVTSVRLFNPDGTIVDYSVPTDNAEVIPSGYYQFSFDSTTNRFSILVTSDAKGLESTKIDSSAGATDEVLEASTNAGVVRLFTNIDITNEAKLSVQSGETLNGVTDGTFLFSNYTAGTQFRADEINGGWVVSVVGASSTLDHNLITAASTDIVGVSGATFVYNNTNPASGQVAINGAAYYDEGAYRYVRADLVISTDPNTFYEVGSNIMPAGGEIISATLSSQESGVSGNYVAVGTVTGQTDQFFTNRIDSIDNTDIDISVWLKISNPAGQGAVVLAGMVTPEKIDRLVVSTGTTLSDTSTLVQTTFSSAGNIHSYFDTLEVASTSGDIIDNGDGTYTLKAGSSYKLTAQILPYDSGTQSAVTDWRWHDGTSYVGIYGHFNSSGSSSRGANGDAIHYTGNLATDTTYSIRTAQSSSQIDGVLRGTYLEIEKIPTGTVVMPDALQVNLVSKVMGKVFDTDAVGTIGSLTFEGDITSAVKTDNKTAVITHPAIDLDAIVHVGVESLGSIDFDNDLRNPVFKRDSTTQLTIFVEETGAVAQNIAWNISMRKNTPEYNVVNTQDAPLPSSFVDHGDWDGVDLNTVVGNGVIRGTGVGASVNGFNGGFFGITKVTSIGDWIQQDWQTWNSVNTAMTDQAYRQSFDGGTSWTAWIGN